MNTYLSAGFITKKKIFDSFYSLVMLRPYKDVKISDICELAGVSRATFYHHFKSKYDVAVWHSTMFLETGLDQIGVTLTWFEGHLVTTRGITVFYDFYSRLEPPEVNSRLFDSFHATHRAEAMRRTITEVKGLELTPRIDFQVNACACSEERAIRDWYQGRVDADIKEVCEFMVSIVPSDLYRILEKPETPTGLRGAWMFKELMTEPGIEFID